MDRAGYMILVLNLLLGVGYGWHLARRLSRLGKTRSSLLRNLGILILVYLVECAAFAASMATDVLSILLAFVWGVVLASLHRPPFPEIRRTPGLVFQLSLYSSLPAASFLSVPVLMAINGWSVVSIEAGTRFGLPTFIPWPMNTILGFCLVVSSIAVVGKILITTRMVRLLTKTPE